MSYRITIRPKSQIISLELLEELKRLIHQGYDVMVFAAIEDPSQFEFFALKKEDVKSKKEE